MVNILFVILEFPGPDHLPMFPYIETEECTNETDAARWAKIKRWGYTPLIHGCRITIYK